jgi:3-methyl-2-oxobutanoate hydroxymethyltransferase
MSEKEVRKVTLHTLKTMKAHGKKAVFLTAYDYPMAKFADDGGVDMILVGDSVGNTTLGYTSTIPVTMDDMIRHSRAVTKATKRAFVIGDMPFMSYQPSDEIAIKNAGRFIAEAECDAVKCEGGKRVAQRIKAMVDAGIVVMGHLGLTPQSIAQLGGYRIQGRTDKEIDMLKEDILAIEAAGAHFVLLEAMPPRAGKILHDAVSIPVYGIGVGPHVDGQLVIVHDMLRMQSAEILKKPKFVKVYADVGKIITEAIAQYAKEVRDGTFPAEEHFYEVS